MAWKTWSQSDLFIVRNAWTNCNKCNGQAINPLICGHFAQRNGASGVVTVCPLEEHFNVVNSLVQLPQFPPFGDYVGSRTRKAPALRGQWFDKDYFLKRLLENLRVYISQDALALANSRINFVWDNKFNQVQIQNLNTKLGSLITPTQQNKAPLPTYIGDGFLASDFVWEHVVPTSYFVQHLSNLQASGNLNQQTLNQLIDMYGMVCIITKDEDNWLTGAGLKSTMPDSNWTDPATGQPGTWNWANPTTLPNNWYTQQNTPWGRYDVVGIQI